MEVTNMVMNEFDDEELLESDGDNSVDLDEKEADESKMDEFDYDKNEDDDIFSDVAED